MFAALTCALSAKNLEYLQMSLAHFSEINPCP